MSVDTYLKGKNLDVYERVEQEGVEILVAPQLVKWAQQTRLDAKPGLLRERFTIAVDHRHQPT